jgi:predicted transcriptional regulator
MNREDWMPKAAADERTSRTTTTYETAQSVSVSSSVSLGVPVIKPLDHRRSKNIEAAVYSYIQALRSLGKTQINTAEIAKALGIPISIVASVLPKLGEKGIRRAG